MSGYVDIGRRALNTRFVKKRLKRHLPKPLR
jgi:hypothetical protein